MAKEKVEKEKPAKEETPKYTEGEMHERAEILRKLVSEVVAYFDGGWRYGRLALVSENNLTACVVPIMGAYSTAKPHDLFLSVMDVKPNDIAPARGGGFILSPGGLRIPHNTAPAPVVTAETPVEDLGIVAHVPATVPPVVVNGSLAPLDLVAAAKAQHAAATPNARVSAEEIAAASPALMAAAEANRPLSAGILKGGANVVATGTINWDPARIIELFKQGTGIQDIAIAMGYAKGQGNNRTKAVLKKAGLI